MNEHQSDPSSDVDDDEDQQQVDCCVYLMRRETTVVFLLCRNTRCCEDCSIYLEKCPICRSTIVQRYQIRKCLNSKVETASTKYHLNRKMVRPNNLVNRIMVRPNNLVNRIMVRPNNLVNRIMVKLNNLVNRIFVQPNNLVKQIIVDYIFAYILIYYINIYTKNNQA